MRRLVYIVMLLLIQVSITNVFAGERSKEAMRMAALNTLSKSNNARKKAATTKASDLKEYVAMEKLSIIGSEDLGFAVITNDDRFDEVIGYSVSEFSEAMPCGFKWWIETVDNNMRTIDVPKYQPSKARGSSNGTGPLLTTIWGQDWPFNNYCTISDGTNNYQCVTGCVATAMAQVMNYFKFPARGTGSNTYNINYNNNAFTVTFSEDFSQSVYDWDNMLDDYTSYYYNRTQDDHTKAVAKLMKDCGVSVNMRYSDANHGSASSLRNAEYALKTYFFYDDSTKFYNRSYYQNKDEWMDIIYEALDNGIPIIYSGQVNDAINAAGHAFVLHGYDSSGKVLINWGWCGQYDGYFDIDLLDPINYCYHQSMIIAIPEDKLTPKMYTLNLTAIGSGCVYYESLDRTKVREGSQSFQIREGDNVDLLLSPDEGHKIKSVKVNNKDVTSAVVDNKYTLVNVLSSTEIVVEFEEIPIDPVIPQCATPSISYKDGEINFSCATEGVKFVSEVSVSDAKMYSGSRIKVTKVYKVSVYATKDGYNNSDVMTREIVIGSSNTNAIKGDVDGNGEVNEADHIKLSEIILQRK